MGYAAVLVADDRILPGRVEARLGVRDLAGQQHHVDVVPGNQEPVNEVLAGRPEVHRRAGGYADLVGRERPDLPGQPNLILARSDLFDTRLLEHWVLGDLRR